jgi:hypothetical protein
MQLHNSNSSPNIIKMIIPRRMRFPADVALMEDKGNAYRILLREPEE